MRLEERKKQVLRDLVEEYLRTGAAVGSKAIAARAEVTVSPATVRNVLAELTREGLIEQSHRSAGRVPTDRAWRLYLDDLLCVDQLPESERELIARALASVADAEAQPLVGAARLLSELSRQAGLLLTQSVEQVRLQRIEFIRVGHQKVLVLLITAHGLVHERLLSSEYDFSADDLQRFTNFINEQVDGCTFAELRERLEIEKTRVGMAARLLAERAVELAARALDGLPTGGEVYVEGQANIVDYEELTNNSQRLRELLEMLEDRKRVASLLGRVAGGEGVQVLLGEEAGLGGMPVSLVAAPCRVGESGQVVGTLGVIGPTRMNYRRIVGLVSYLSKLVGQRYESGAD